MGPGYLPKENAFGSGNVSGFHTDGWVNMNAEQQMFTSTIHRKPALPTRFIPNHPSDGSRAKLDVAFKGSTKTCEESAC